jgi:nucleotide-binding universal stress UspA family protein
MSVPDPKSKAEPAPVMLVAYDGGAMGESQLHMACRSALDLQGRIVVLHVVVRPQQVPLDQPLTAEEQAQLDRLQARVEAIADRHGVQCEFTVVESRSVGTAIIAEASERPAHMIFLGLRERRRPGTTLLLSGTVRYVLRHTPCQIQIGYVPAAVLA